MTTKEHSISDALHGASGLRHWTATQLQKAAQAVACKGRGAEFEVRFGIRGHGRDSSPNLEKTRSPWPCLEQNPQQSGQRRGQASSILDHGCVADLVCAALANPTLVMLLALRAQSFCLQFFNS